MILQLVIRYLLYLFHFLLFASKKLQNFQPSGFQFYDSMTFVIPSTAHGRSSFRGTRSNDANPVSASDDIEDTPSVFISFYMTISILISTSSGNIFTTVESTDAASVSQVYFY